VPRDVVDATRRFWEEAFNGRDLSVLDELIAEDYVNHAALPETPPGTDGQRASRQVAHVPSHDVRGRWPGDRAQRDPARPRATAADGRALTRQG